MELPSFDMGPIKVAPALVLAPMSGVTDAPFRQMIKRASGDDVGLVVSEFISIEMLTQHHLRSLLRMTFHPSERPVSIQLYGADVGRMAEAAKMVEDAGADSVELNAGCPAPKIVRRGGGAGLLKNLPLMGRILEAIVKSVSIPVTVKIRNGWCSDSLNALETLKVAESSGVVSIGVHGRTRQALYTGQADWDIIREMKQVAKIPVLGSGDVITPQDAIHRFKTTGCDGLLVGRGAIRNPWIFRQIADVMRNPEAPPFLPTWADTLDLLRTYRESLDEMYPAKVAPGRMKMMFSRLLKEVPDARELRIQCLRLNTPDEMLDMLEKAFIERGILHTTQRAA